jgi:hypothetical protein
MGNILLGICNICVCVVGDRTKTLVGSRGAHHTKRSSVLSRIAHCPHESTIDPQLKEWSLANRSLLANDLVEWSRDLDDLRAAKDGVSEPTETFTNK